MKQSRHLLATGYWLAVLLVVLPALERLVPLLPLRPSVLPWRLQAFGALSLSLLLPTVGVTVAIATAALLQQRRVVRVLAVAAYAAALLIAAASILFALDLVQYRASVGAELQQYYRTAGATYLVCFLLAISFLVWLGAVSWRATARSRQIPQAPPQKGPLAHGPPGSGWAMAHGEDEETATRLDNQV